MYVHRHTHESSLTSSLAIATPPPGQATKDMSGGWRMRVALAQALRLGPNVGKTGSTTEDQKDLYVYMYMCTYTKKFTCIYMYIYIHTFIHVSIYMYRYAHTHKASRDGKKSHMVMSHPDTSAAQQESLS